MCVWLLNSFLLGSQFFLDHETFKNNDAEAVDDEASENQVDVDDVEVDELESDDGEEELDTYGMDLVIKCLLYTFYAQFPLIKHFEVFSFCL